MLLAQTLDDALLDNNPRRKFVQMTIRRLAALELLDQLNSNDWTITKGVAYPTVQSAISFKDLTRASAMAKARDRLDSSFRPKDSKKDNKKDSKKNNNANNSNNSNSNNNNNNQNSGGRGSRQGQ